MISLRDLGPEKPCKFLQDEPRHDDGVAAFERVAQSLDFGLHRLRVAPERKRPDAGIDQKRHLRERSAL